MADGAPTEVARVRLSIEEDVATIALVREARMNAFDEDMHADLRLALTAVENDASVRAVILTGSGRAFSSGQDLGERAATFSEGNVPDLRASLENNYNALVRRLAQLPMPVIAAVNGVAFGAGAALAIACDIVVAARSAKFQFGFVNVGLGPDSGASWHLPRLVGPALSMDLALTARPVLADEAMAIGLVSRVVEDDDLSGAVTTIAREIAAKSPPAVAAVKRQLRANPLGDLDAALDAERDTQALLGSTAEYREAVLRFSRPRA